MASGADVLDEGGEGYFASVSDLMVGILFVFLLMLTVFALNFRDAEDDQNVKRAELIAAQAEAKTAKDRAEREEARAVAATAEASRQEGLALAARAEAARERDEAVTQKEKNRQLVALLEQAVARLDQEIDDRVNARRRLVKTLQVRLAGAGLTVQIDPATEVLRLPEQLLFEKGQSDLGMVAGPSGVRLDAAKRGEAQGKLAVLGTALAEVLPCFGGRGGASCPEKDRSTLDGVLIEGHSDRQGYRGLSADESRDRNDLLSVERALAVFKEVRTRNGLGDLLNSQGLPMLAVSAYGERRPISVGDKDEELRANRRIDLRFLLSSRPSDELKAFVAQIRRQIGESEGRAPQ